MPINWSEQGKLHDVPVTGWPHHIKYKVLGKETSFSVARDSLLEKVALTREPSQATILYELLTAPSYNDLLLLPAVSDKKTEIGVLKDKHHWYAFSGSMGDPRRVRGPTSQFWSIVRDGDIIFHLHPIHQGEDDISATPSIFDIAYATKNAGYGVISKTGITVYTGIKWLDSQDIISSDPFVRLSFLREHCWNLPIKRHLEEYKKREAEITTIPWGEGAKKYWENLTAM